MGAPPFYFPMIQLTKTGQASPSQIFKAGRPPEGAKSFTLQAFSARNEIVALVRPFAFESADLATADASRTFAWVEGTYRFEVVQLFKGRLQRHFVGKAKRARFIFLPPMGREARSGFGYGAPICAWTTTFDFMSGYLVGLNAAGEFTEVWAFQDEDVERKIVGISAWETVSEAWYKRISP